MEQRSRVPTQQVIAVVALLAATGCSSYDDSPTRKDTEALAMDDKPSDCGAAKTFSSLRPTLFAKCGGGTCHDPGNESNVVVFSGESTPYETVVGAPSKTVRSLKLVEPGKPSRSFLYRKISATHVAACEGAFVTPSSCGDQMPLNDWFGLAKETTEDTRRWIVCGANP
jgi:hypothetical protein